MRPVRRKEIAQEKRLERLQTLVELRASLAAARVSLAGPRALALDENSLGEVLVLFLPGYVVVNTVTVIQMAEKTRRSAKPDYRRESTGRQ